MEQEKEKQTTSDLENFQPENKNANQTFHKLLPLFSDTAVMCEFVLKKLAERTRYRNQRIAVHKEKIQKLENKVEKLEDINKFLKLKFADNKLAKRIIERNEKKITKIKDVKIPKRKRKIEKHMRKVDKYKFKQTRTQHKLDRAVALNNVVTSFFGVGKKRRQAFTSAMDNLRKAEYNCAVDKKVFFERKIEKLQKIKSSDDISEVEKINIEAKLQKLEAMAAKAEENIKKFILEDNHFEKQPDNVVNNAMQETYKAAEQAEKQNKLPPIEQVSQNFISSAVEAEQIMTEQQMMAEQQFNQNNLPEPPTPYEVFYQNNYVSSVSPIPDEVFNQNNNAVPAQPTPQQQFNQNNNAIPAQPTPQQQFNHNNNAAPAQPTPQQQFNQNNNAAPPISTRTASTITFLKRQIESLNQRANSENISVTEKNNIEIAIKRLNARLKEELSSPTKAVQNNTSPNVDEVSNVPVEKLPSPTEAVQNNTSPNIGDKEDKVEYGVVRMNNLKREAQKISNNQPHKQNTVQKNKNGQEL